MPGVVAAAVVVGFILGDGFEFVGGDDGVAFDEEFEAVFGEELVGFGAQAAAEAGDKSGELGSDGDVCQVDDVVSDELMAVGIGDHRGGVTG